MFLVNIDLSHLPENSDHPMWKNVKKFTYYGVTKKLREIFLHLPSVQYVGW